MEPALWATGTAALIAGTGVLFGQLQLVGLAYLGAACAVIFLVRGFYRARWWAWVSQAIGGAVGISVGAQLWPGFSAGQVLTAAVAGAISGMVGGAGPSAPAFGLMLSIGVAFGQFGGSSLPWWQQALWYLVGTSVAAVSVLAPWAFHRDKPERRAQAAVYFAAADLCVAIGTERAGAARDRLAAASAVARAARDRRGADLVAFAAATLYAQGRPVPDVAVSAIHQAGQQIWKGKPVSVAFTEADVGTDPGLVELADALSRQPKRPGTVRPETLRLSVMLRAATSRAGLANGLRLALCMGMATALTVAIRQPAHSFWLPLTTAVIVRLEYASVFVRTVNRIFGTLIGALVATAVLAVLAPGVPLVVVTALALGFVVLSVPKLYGFAVIGITTSALLSQSIGQVDPVAPAVRLLDTLVGAAVAVVFGYLLWPEARRFPAYAQLVGGLKAAHCYLNEAVKPAAQRPYWQPVRADAYRLAHQVRATAEAAALEPPPVSSLALQVIPAAIELEDTVDAITAVGSAVDAGGEASALVVDVRRRLDKLDRTAAEWASGPLGSSGYGRLGGSR
ncbi:FUSC family protein [Mycobacterium montefiorense]|uniref:Membrane protein n=1 Tax=Mycobacterium montefiorense TaxID=154654 RepID=A0AA37PJA2_9MYCO|nr:FUSC family protein [Mycobacterium montefiorense]GBG38416.1 membrane protein [Mycobacterium montefiorense]GKU34245.1 membrane protein [Mycobacterium montefiorense]GKU38864.1 membrane protein [Mycobacterium montefiorense]GKU48100.1 membrane protein [Mycobacterium montefiorense]GKU49628.1 membrane protein [Mycobacterium montefiorense]